MIRKEIKDDFQNADLISSQSRYDRFDTTAYLVFIASPYPRRHSPAQSANISIIPRNGPFVNFFVVVLTCKAF